MKKATHDVVELGLGVKMESMVQEKDKDIEKLKILQGTVGRHIDN